MLQFDPKLQLALARHLAVRLADIFRRLVLLLPEAVHCIVAWLSTIKAVAFCWRGWFSSWPALIGIPFVTTGKLAFWTGIWVIIEPPDRLLGWGSIIMSRADTHGSQSICWTGHIAITVHGGHHGGPGSVASVLWALCQDRWGKRVHLLRPGGPHSWGSMTSMLGPPS